MFGRLEGESTALLNEAIELSYFMRGSISYEQILLRTPVERRLIGEFVKTRLEGEMKKSFPVY
jgi:hypothetical protein